MLIRACLAGDHRAWEALIRRYQRLIYAIPFRCGLNEDDAADVFQSTCLQLLENLERLRDRERLVHWLATTARREAWRIWQTAHGVARLPPDPEDPKQAAPEVLTAGTPLPDENLLRMVDEQLVRQAKEALGERCRNLLTWLYQTEPPPSYAAIAAWLDLADGSIGPMRARCLHQLKKNLKEIGF